MSVFAGPQIIFLGTKILNYRIIFVILACEN